MIPKGEFMTNFDKLTGLTILTKNRNMVSNPSFFFVGKAGSGKTTAQNYLKNKGYTSLHFAFGVYEIAKRYFGMENKDRKLLQIIGQTARIIEPDYWIKNLIKDISKNPGMHYTVDDCRFRNEFKTLKDLGFIGVYLDCSEEVRMKRLESRDGSIQQNTLKDISETEMDSFREDMNYKIDSSINTDDLNNKIEDIIKREANK